MDELLDIAQVAAYLGVSTRTVYSRVRSGEIPAARVGRLWRVSATDLAAWLEAGRSGGPGAVPVPAPRRTTRDTSLGGGPYPHPAVGAPMAAEGGGVPSREDLVVLMDRFTDQTERRLAFVAMLTSAVEAIGWTAPVVVGGHAVEFYTAGDYATVDIDLVGASEAIGTVLGEWGFEKQGRHWYDTELDIVVEAPGSGLEPGEVRHVNSVAIGRHTAYVLGVEDLVIDRLKACVHWTDQDSCMWARVLLAGAAEVDLDYLRERALAEGVDEELTAALGKAGIP
jgi:excisionase family DNA binding protein